MNQDESYIEACIRALPLEKQNAARKAYNEISDAGSGGFIDKFLMLLEASGAYAKTIPVELKSVSDSLTRDLEAFRSREITQRAAEENRREKLYRQVLAEEMPRLAKGLAVTRLAESIDAQKAILDRLAHNILSMRQLRVGGLLLLMALSAIGGAAVLGGICWKRYQTGQDAYAYWKYLSQMGIRVSSQEVENTVVVTVLGAEPLLRGTSRKDNQGRTMGIDLTYSK